MLHAKFRGNRPAGSREFEGFYQITIIMIIIVIEKQ